MGLFTNSIVSIPKRQIDTFTSWTDSSKDKEPTPINYETFYKAYKQCPEYLAVIESVVTDIISDGGTFTSDTNNKEDIEAMEKHILKIGFVKKLKKWLRHGLISGDGYLETHILTLSNFKSIVKSVYKEVYGNSVSKDITFMKNAIRRRTEKVSKVEAFPFNVYPIKTSGMTKRVDSDGKIIAYLQDVNSKKVEFSPDEIVDWMPIDLDEVYGMSPSQAVTDDIATLLFAKQYAGKFFENGGFPNMLFILEKARGANDRNYEVAKTEIKNARKKQNWQKNLVMTGGGGGIKVEKLNDFKKDMEFIELINVCIRNIAMGFGVPPSKVPYKMESKGDLKEMNEGYWKDINEYQNQIEGLVNPFIFSFYGLKWRFNRSYKIDELREANIIALLRDRGIIGHKESRTRIGYFGDIPEDDKPIERPAADQKHRDIGAQQDGRGTGADNGSKLTPKS